MWRVFAVSPGAKVSTPEAAWKSSPARAAERAFARAARQQFGASNELAADCAPREWTAVSAEDADSPAAQSVRDVVSPPASEAYVLRRRGAARLVDFSLAHGLGAVDILIAKAFAPAAQLAAFPVGPPYDELLRNRLDVHARWRDLQPALAPTEDDAWARRVYLVEPPVARQAQGQADSDIQNWILVDGREVHLREMFGKAAPA